MAKINFYLVSIGNRPILAIPKSSRASKLASIGCYPAQTWKKKLIKAFIYLIFYLCMENFFFSKQFDFSSIKPSLDFENWLEFVFKKLQLSAKVSVIIWPPEVNRGRLYVYFLDGYNDLKAFSKFALDDKNNTYIKNEYRALSKFQECDFLNTQIPSVLLEGSWKNCNYLLTQTIPINSHLVNSSRDLFPDKNVNEYSGGVKKLTFNQFQKSFWWQDFCQKSNEVLIFSQEVFRLSQEGINTCTAHGDLGSTNIFKCKDKLWFIDWERSADDAPMLTDDVAFYVGTHHHHIKRNTSSALQNFLQKYLHGGSYNYVDVVMALAFLHGAKFSPATILIKQWEKEGLNVVL